MEILMADLIIYIENITPSDITITDLGLVLISGAYIDLTLYCTIDEIIKSTDILPYIDDGSILVYDNDLHTTPLSISNAKLHLNIQTEYTDSLDELGSGSPQSIDPIEFNLAILSNTSEYDKTFTYNAITGDLESCTIVDTSLNDLFNIVYIYENGMLSNKIITRSIDSKVLIITYIYVNEILTGTTTRWA